MLMLFCQTKCQGKLWQPLDGGCCCMEAIKGQGYNESQCTLTHCIDLVIETTALCIHC